MKLFQFLIEDCQFSMEDQFWRDIFKKTVEELSAILIALPPASWELEYTKYITSYQQNKPTFGAAGAALILALLEQHKIMEKCKAYHQLEHICNTTLQLSKEGPARLELF